MVRMQFPLNSEYGNDGRIHEIVPTRLFYKDFDEKQCYLLMSYRNDFDDGNVARYESVIIRDGGNFACIHSNVVVEGIEKEDNYQATVVLIDEVINISSYTAEYLVDHKK